MVLIESLYPTYDLKSKAITHGVDGLKNVFKDLIKTNNISKDTFAFWRNDIFPFYELNFKI